MWESTHNREFRLEIVKEEEEIVPRCAKYLERLGSLFVSGAAEVDGVDADDLVSAAQVAAQVGRPARQDERHEDALAVLAADDVEAQPRGALLEHHRPRLPATRKQH